jgi:hypothetical protein
MNMLEAYIQFTPGLITDSGEVTDDAIGEFLSNYMKEFLRIHLAGVYRVTQDCVAPSGCLAADHTDECEEAS